MSYGGLILPEFEIRDLVQGAVEVMATTPALVAQYLRARPAAEQDSFITALQNRDGKVRLGLGRDAAEDWTVNILVADTRPSEQTIGGAVSHEYEEPLFDPIQLATGIDAEEGIVLSLVGGIPVGLPSAGRVRLEAEVATYAIGGGPTRILLLHRGVDGTDAVPHDNNSFCVFHTMNREIGWGERESIHIHVVSSNTVFNALLARMLGGFLIAARPDFEDRGFTIMGISQSEMAPRPAAWPSEWLTRTLMLEVRTKMSVPETFPTITDVKVEVGLVPLADDGPTPGMFP